LCQADLSVSYCKFNGEFSDYSEVNRFSALTAPLGKGLKLN
jgi:hypothetical protein